ncbi:hypothetical protein DFR29_12546 [Tahibacter aquaticus]|uniref:Uncharacterized protein n=1 Tax=Tahibacter aquaticus TaxID=520092 RepID=A0A4R6YK06_9GAMM|nr:hypothetical protein [Tahibacter aquaticus]TDR37384.1 hypothetical protein DFR29_12546 [Tahibacter aquaticus]
MKQSITANVGTMSFPAYLPRQPSAHDFLYDVQLRGEILRLASTPQIFQMTNNPLAGPLIFILGHVDATMGFTSGIVLTIEIVFLDGSSVKLRATLNEQAAYVANSAVDGTGQTLPDPTTNAPGYAGRWYYPPGHENNMARFLEYMRQLGVNVQYGATGSGSGVIVCHWKPENNETICMVPR